MAEALSYDPVEQLEDIFEEGSKFVEDPAAAPVFHSAAAESETAPEFVPSPAGTGLAQTTSPSQTPASTDLPETGGAAALSSEVGSSQFVEQQVATLLASLPPPLVYGPAPIVAADAALVGPTTRATGPGFGASVFRAAGTGAAPVWMLMGEPVSTDRFWNDANEDLNGNGVLDPGEDANVNGALDPTLAELRAALDASDAIPGNVTLTEAGDVSSLTIRIVKTLEGPADLEILSEVLGGLLNLKGTIEIAADVTLNLTIGADSSGYFIQPNSGSAPEASVSNIRIVGDVKAAGQLGFLGVTVTGAALNVDPAVIINIKLRDPGTETADGMRSV